jgi:hypothetical protein
VFYVFRFFFSPFVQFDNSPLLLNDGDLFVRFPAASVGKLALQQTLIIGAPLEWRVRVRISAQAGPMPLLVLANEDGSLRLVVSIDELGRLTAALADVVTEPTDPLPTNEFVWLGGVVELSDGGVLILIYDVNSFDSVPVRSAFVPLVVGGGAALELALGDSMPHDVDVGRVVLLSRARDEHELAKRQMFCMSEGECLGNDCSEVQCVDCDGMVQRICCPGPVSSCPSCGTNAMEVLTCGFFDVVVVIDAMMATPSQRVGILVELRGIGPQPEFAPSPPFPTDALGRVTFGNIRAGERLAVFIDTAQPEMANARNGSLDTPFDGPIIIPFSIKFGDPLVFERNVPMVFFPPPPPNSPCFDDPGCTVGFECTPGPQRTCCPTGCSQCGMYSGTPAFDGLEAGLVCSAHYLTIKFNAVNTVISTELENIEFVLYHFNQGMFQFVSNAFTNLAGDGFLSPLAAPLLTNELYRVEISVSQFKFQAIHNATTMAPFDNTIAIEFIARNGGDLNEHVNVNDLLLVHADPEQPCGTNAQVCVEGNHCAPFPCIDCADEFEAICCPGDGCLECSRSATEVLSCEDFRLRVRFNTTDRPGSYESFQIRLFNSSIVPERKRATFERGVEVAVLSTDATGAVDFGAGPPDLKPGKPFFVVVFMEELDGLSTQSGAYFESDIEIMVTFNNGDPRDIEVVIEDVYIPGPLGAPCDDENDLCHPEDANCADPCSEDDCHESAVARVCCPFDGETFCDECGNEAGEIEPEFVCGDHFFRVDLALVGDAEPLANELFNIEVKIEHLDVDDESVIEEFVGRTDAFGLLEIDGGVRARVGHLYRVVVNTTQPEMTHFRNGSLDTPFSGPITVPVLVNNGGDLEVRVKIALLPLYAQGGEVCDTNLQVCGAGLTCAPSECGDCLQPFDPVCCPGEFEPCFECGRNVTGALICSDFKLNVFFNLTGRPYPEHYDDLVIDVYTAIEEMGGRKRQLVHDTSLFTGIVTNGVVDFAGADEAVNPFVPYFVVLTSAAAEGLVGDDGSPILEDRAYPLLFRNNESLIVDILISDVHSPVFSGDACDQILSFCTPGVDTCADPCSEGVCDQSAVQHICCPNVDETPCHECGIDDSAEPTLVCGSHVLNVDLDLVGEATPVGDELLDISVVISEVDLSDGSLSPVATLTTDSDGVLTGELPVVSVGHLYRVSIDHVQLEHFGNGDAVTPFVSPIVRDILIDNGGPLRVTVVVDTLFPLYAQAGGACDEQQCAAGLSCALEDCRDCVEGHPVICCPGVDCAECGRTVGNELSCEPFQLQVRFNTTGRPPEDYEGITISIYDDFQFSEARKRIGNLLTSAVTNEVGLASAFDAAGLDPSRTYYAVVDSEDLGGAFDAVTGEPFGELDIEVEFVFHNNDPLLVDIVIQDVIFAVDAGFACNEPLPDYCDPRFATCTTRLCTTCAPDFERTCCPLDGGQAPCDECGFDVESIVCGTHTVSAHLVRGSPSQVSGVVIELRNATISVSATTDESGSALFAGTFVPGEQYQLFINTSQVAMADAVNSDGLPFEGDVLFDVSFGNGFGPLAVVFDVDDVFFVEAALGEVCGERLCADDASCVAPTCQGPGCSEGDPSICCQSRCTTCGTNDDGEVLCQNFNFTVLLGVAGTAEQLAGVPITVEFDEGKGLIRQTVATNSLGEALFLGMKAYRLMSVRVNVSSPEFDDARDLDGQEFTEDIVVAGVYFRNGDPLDFVHTIDNFVFLNEVGLLEVCNDLNLLCEEGVQCAERLCGDEGGSLCVEGAARICCPFLPDAACNACGADDDDGDVECGQHIISLDIDPFGSIDLTGIEVQLQRVFFEDTVIIGTVPTNSDGLATFAGTVTVPGEELNLIIDIGQPAFDKARTLRGTRFEQDIVIPASYLNGAPLSVRYTFSELTFVSNLGEECASDAQCAPGECVESTCEPCDPSFVRTCCPQSARVALMAARRSFAACRSRARRLPATAATAAAAPPPASAPPRRSSKALWSRCACRAARCRWRRAAPTRRARSRSTRRSCRASRTSCSSMSRKSSSAT